MFVSWSVEYNQFESNVCLATGEKNGTHNNCSIDMPTKVQASILWETKLDYNGSFQNVQIGAGETLNIDMK